jgi:hypothetical protein
MSPPRFGVPDGPAEHTHKANMKGPPCAHPVCSVFKSTPCAAFVSCFPPPSLPRQLVCINDAPSVGRALSGRRALCPPLPSPFSSSRFPPKPVCTRAHSSVFTAAIFLMLASHHHSCLTRLLRPRWARMRAAFSRRRHPPLIDTKTLTDPPWTDPPLIILYPTVAYMCILTACKSSLFGLESGDSVKIQRRTYSAARRFETLGLLSAFITDIHPRF